MDSHRQPLEQQPAQTLGLAGEFQQLQTDGQASAAELREFLGHLKGRSPEEVMGVVAQSGLIQSTVLATVGCVVLLAVCTIVPYALKDSPSDVKEQAAPTVGGESAPTDAERTVDATDSVAPRDQATNSSEPDLERAAEAMGIGGAAEADPNKNPLDSKLDNLLDGIE